MIDIADFADPVEVWKAVEGEPFDLIALLRGSEPIRRRTRDALADFLAGELSPVRLPKGRPMSAKGKSRSYMLHAVFRGHDVSTPIGAAGFHYDIVRQFIRSKGWHRGHPRWSDRLKEAVAKRRGIDLDKFINYLNRSRPKPKSRPWSGDEYVQRRRIEIARQIRHSKKDESD